MENKTFRVFVSSTFSDFRKERELLNVDIYNKLNDFCQSKGYNFQLVDLRWGVTTEAALNQQTLSICLDEVRRCREMSPKPNFLLMIGERYGWMPLPNTISAEDFDVIISDAESEDSELLKYWYKLDMNAINAEYFLIPRYGMYISDDNWYQVESRIFNVLMKKCTEDGRISKSLRDRVGVSATECEVIEGMFNDTESSDNVIAVFRNGFDDTDSDLASITSLRKKIIDRLAKNECLDHLYELCYDDQYKEVFIQTVTNALIENISKEISKIEKNRQIDEDENIPQVLRRNLEEFYFRDNDLNSLETYIHNSRKHSLIVFGESGSGKSTLLKEYISNHLADDAVDIYGLFYGIDEDSFSLLQGLKLLCNKIQSKYEIYNLEEINEYNLSEVFITTMIEIPETKHVVIFIDGLESFNDINDIHENFVPLELPQNISLIISVADEKVMDNFKHTNTELLNMNNFSKEESIAVFNKLLSTKGRCVYPENQKAICNFALSKGLSPLHVRILADIVVSWHSDEEAYSLPDSAEKAAILYIERMFLKYGYNKDFVIYSLSLIAASPYGIDENEIREIILRIPAVKEAFIREDRYSYNEERLPYAVWSKFFFDMRNCLELVQHFGRTVLGFDHNIFKYVIKKYYSDYYNKSVLLLTEYYCAQNNFFDSENWIINIQKTVNLPELLKISEDYDRMAQLYLESDFISCVIQCSGSDKAKSDLKILLDKTKNNNEDSELQHYLEIIRNNSSFLSCFMSELYSFINSDLVFSNNYLKVCFENKADETIGTTLPFPYPQNSKVRFCNNKKIYAAFLGSYVYIYDAMNEKEIARIYFQPINKRIQHILEVFWLNKSKVAIVSDGGNDFHIKDQNINAKLYIYEIDNSIPKQCYCFECDGLNCHEAVIPAVNILYFVKNNTLYAFDYSINSIVAEKKIQKQSWISVDYSSNKLNIYFHKVNRICFSQYDPYTLRTTSSSTEKVSGYETKQGIGFSEKSIKKLSNGMTAYVFLDINEFVIYNKRRKNYIVPPNLNSLLDCYTINDGLMFVYPETLLYVDVEDLIIRHLDFQEKSSFSFDSSLNTVVAINKNQMKIINIEDFTDTDIKIFTSKKSQNIFLQPLYDMLQRLKDSKTFAPTGSYFSIFEGWEHNIATLYFRSHNGSEAIVFEGNEFIIIKNAATNEQFSINKLGLTLKNHILEAFFSDNSRYFLLRTNSYIVVLDLFSKKKIFNLKVSAYIVSVAFTENGFEIVARNPDKKSFIKKTYIFKAHKMSSKRFLVKEKDVQIQSLPYKLNPDDSTFRDKTIVPVFFNLYSVNNNKGYISCAVNDMNYYFTSGVAIKYKNGQFFMRDEVGNYSKRFSAPGYNFSRMFQIQRNMVKDAFDAFSLQKNDFFSALKQIGDNKLLLVCRAMNSVVVFDTKKMKVLTAYMHHGKIIGVVFDEPNNSFQLVSPEKPYFTTIKYNPF